MTFLCPKCSTTTFYLSELRGSSGGFSAMFDLDISIFTTVICSKCGFTELFYGDSTEFKKRLGLEGGPLYGKAE